MKHDREIERMRAATAEDERLVASINEICRRSEERTRNRFLLARAVAAVAIAKAQHRKD